MKKFIALGAAITLASLSAPALQAEETGSGCGLGAVVLEGKSGKGAHIAAVLINGLVIPNTTFMTTGGGLMGCDPTQTVQKDEATEVFVARNMDQLSTDVAQGGGEYLEVLAELMGVADEDRAAFQKVAQRHYDDLFTQDADAQRVIDSIETAMLSDDTLSKYAIN